jgi:GH18 family chitinase
VLGYLPGSGDWYRAIDQVDMTRITDLNLAFVNADSAGNYPSPELFRPIVEKARAGSVRIFFSIGGGSPPPHLEHLLHPDRRDQWVRSTAALAEQAGFDGVDVDLENALINEHYAPFVYQLSLALKEKNKLMTAALASWNADKIHDSTIRRFDLVNIMSYDKTGPWNPDRPGPHSPYQMVVDDFTYFNGRRNIPSGKLLVGLPFYGYGFGSGKPLSMRYRDIVSTYPEAAGVDSVRLSSGYTLYYNGVPTITKKVEYAMEQKAAGVMIWQLLGDSRDSTSLLNSIHARKTRKDH